MFPFYYLFVFFIAEVLIFILFLSFLYLSFKKLKKSDLFSLGLLGSLFAFLIAEVTKSVLPISRPQNPLLGFREGSSFPSTHSSVVFALATAVYLVDKKLGYLFYIGALLVALGRVLGGVHSILDVSAGLILGVLCTYLIYKYSVHLIFGKKKK